MAKSLEQIQQQIAKLEQQAEVLKLKEKSGVIERIRTAIEHYSLTPLDLFDERGSKATPGRNTKATGRTTPEEKASSEKVARKGIPVAIKYRDADGNAWTGRGSKPRWLVAAIAMGKKVEDFAVKS